eukprot:2010243-Pleurochrysis_carterae.AAC.1
MHAPHADACMHPTPTRACTPRRRRRSSLAGRRVARWATAASTGCGSALTSCCSASARAATTRTRTRTRRTRATRRQRPARPASASSPWCETRRLARTIDDDEPRKICFGGLENRGPDSDDSSCDLRYSDVVELNVFSVVRSGETHTLTRQESC